MASSSEDSSALAAVASKLRFCGNAAAAAASSASSGQRKRNRQRSRGLFGAAPVASAADVGGKGDDANDLHHQQQSQHHRTPRVTLATSALWRRNETTGVWSRASANGAIVDASQRFLAPSPLVPFSFLPAAAQQQQQQPHEQHAARQNHAVQACAWSITAVEFAEVERRAVAAGLVVGAGVSKEKGAASPLLLDFAGTQALFQLVKLFGSKFTVIADRMSSGLVEGSAAAAAASLSGTLLQGHYGLVTSLLAELRYEKLQQIVHRIRRERGRKDGGAAVKIDNNVDVDDDDGTAEQRSERAAAAAVLETVCLALAREHPIRHQSAAIGTSAQARVLDKDTDEVDAAAENNGAKRSSNNGGAAAAATAVPAANATNLCTAPSSMSVPLTVTPSVLLAREELLRQRAEAIAAEDCLGHAFNAKLRSLQQQAASLSGRLSEHVDREHPADISLTGDLPACETAMQTTGVLERNRYTITQHFGEPANAIDDVAFMLVPRSLVLRTSTGASATVGYLSDLEKYIETRLTPLVPMPTRAAMDRIDGLREVAVATTGLDREAIRLRNATALMRRTKEEADALRREMLAAATEKAAGPECCARQLRRQRE